MKFLTFFFLRFFNIFFYIIHVFFVLKVFFVFIFYNFLRFSKNKIIFFCTFGISKSFLLYFLYLFSKIIKVTTKSYWGDYWTQKITLKKLTFCPKGKKSLGGRQKLEVKPHSGQHLLVITYPLSAFEKSSWSFWQIHLQLLSNLVLKVCYVPRLATSLTFNTHLIHLYGLLVKFHFLSRGIFGLGNIFVNPDLGLIPCSVVIIWNSD